MRVLHLLPTNHMPEVWGANKTNQSMNFQAGNKMTFDCHEATLSSTALHSSSESGSALNHGTSRCLSTTGLNHKTHCKWQMQHFFTCSLGCLWSCLLCCWPWQVRWIVSQSATSQLTCTCTLHATGSPEADIIAQGITSPATSQTHRQVGGLQEPVKNTVRQRKDA